jgi:hypothetical protein
LQDGPRRTSASSFELVDWDKTRHLRPQDVVAAEEMLAARHQRLREMPSVDTLFVFRDESAAASTEALSHAEAAARRERVKKMLKTSLGDEHRKPAPWMLAPDSSTRERVRRAATVCAVYTLFAEPFYVAFDVRPLGDGALVLSCLADALLALDFVVSFLTGYYWLAADGVYKLEMRTFRCISKYIRTDCLRDFLSALPTQLALRMTDPAGHMPASGPTFLRVLEVVKCIVVLRVLQVGAVFTTSLDHQSLLLQQQSLLLVRLY